MNSKLLKTKMPETLEAYGEYQHLSKTREKVI